MKMVNNMVMMNPFLLKKTSQLAKLSLLMLTGASIYQPIYASNFDEEAIQSKTDTTKQIQKLSNNITWKRLLHYPDGSNTSRATKAEFFVSPEGASNPTAEIQAMINAMKSVDDANKGNASVQCLFPARAHWLKKQIDFDFPKASCVEYDQWFNKHHPKHLAVVFPQEYPDNLTSAFAHTLLRIDTNDSNDNNYQDSFAINYTVNGNPSDSMPKYAVKSISGGYAGIMTIEPYLPKIEHYLTKDNRDIWTYGLNLTPEEKQQIVRHIWEVKDLNLPYYFLTDNCSSEILRLIDIVHPQNSLLHELDQFVIPNAAIRLLEKKGLVATTQYVPASNSIAQKKFNQQNATADSSLYSFPDNNPINASNIKRLSIGFGQQGEHSYVELGGRVSYHDLLDRPTGYRQNLEMDTLNLKVRGYNNSESTSDDLQLQEFLILGGHSYNPVNTEKKGSSWGIELGAKQVMDASKNYENTLKKFSREQEHLVGSIGYEKGISYAFGQPNTAYELPKQLCYAFGKGNMQVGKGLTNGFRFGVGAHLGCVYKMNDSLRAKAELNLPYWYHGDTDLQGHIGSYWQPTASLGMQYDISKNHGVRLTTEHEMSSRIEDNTDVQLAWQWYF